jgi:hypothetical protein
MLQNLTRAKYRQALDVVAETRGSLAQPMAIVPAPARKTPSQTPRESSAA